MGNNSSILDSSRSPTGASMITLPEVVKKIGALPVASRYVTSRSISCDYAVERTVLGTGMSGPVVLATSKDDGRRCAVKRLQKSSVSNEARNETEVYLSLDHPHIARLERVYETEQEINLVMEYMAGGELFQWVADSKAGFSEERAASALQQMLSAVSYLHAQRVVHRDLKLENWLYEDSTGKHLQLIDFGFATAWDGQTKMTQSLGTMDYVAPEVLDCCYTDKADMWSMGVIAYAMLTASMPFSGNTDREKTRNIQRGSRDLRTLQRFQNLSNGARDFVNSLLTLDPAKRLGAVEALNHPWVRQTAFGRSGALLDTSMLESLRRFAEASCVKRAWLSVIAWSLPQKDQASIRTLFMALDEDHSGAIELTELVHVLQRFGVTSDEAHTIFSFVDANQDNRITYSELLAATLKQSKEALHETFRRLDADNNGAISPHDIDVVLDGRSSCEACSLIQEADFDRDGEISYSEFEKFMLQAPLRLQTPGRGPYHLYSMVAKVLHSICPFLFDVSAYD